MNKFTDQQLMLLNVLEFEQGKEDDHYLKELDKEYKLSAVPYTNTIWFQLRITEDYQWVPDSDFYANSIAEFLEELFNRGFSMGYEKSENKILTILQITR